MNVAQWLNAIDLGQYEALFREHEIDAGVLPDLVEADLEKIGVPLGHRKRLMRAIAALSAGGTPPSAAKPASAQPFPSPPTSGADAERRPITVMFCDLAGSTSISAALDAEDWRNLVSAYLDAASEAVTQMGGRVAKKLGDGLMALFGHPIAQENDSERAVRAALAIQRALAELNRKNAGAGRPELVARIGVATGPVVVDSAGEIFGDAPNIAARVQALADPGTVMITARVQRQVAGLFVAEDRGAHALKGAPEPTTLYRIVRASGGGRRGGARALTPLVGREDEIVLLMRRWSRALAGEGQFVLIVGEPGIGKSRLIEEFPRQARRDSAHLGRMGRLAAPAKHASSPARRMGTAALRRRRRIRRAETRRSREHFAADRSRGGRLRTPARAAVRRRTAWSTAQRNSRRRNCDAGNWLR